MFKVFFEHKLSSELFYKNTFLNVYHVFSKYILSKNSTFLVLFYRETVVNILLAINILILTGMRF